jgi:hypothetical protein
MPRKRNSVSTFGSQLLTNAAFSDERLKFPIFSHFVKIIISNKIFVIVCAQPVTTLFRFLPSYLLSSLLLPPKKTHLISPVESQPIFS